MQETVLVFWKTVSVDPEKGIIGALYAEIRVYLYHGGSGSSRTLQFIPSMNRFSAAIPHENGTGVLTGPDLAGQGDARAMGDFGYGIRKNAGKIP